MAFPPQTDIGGGTIPLTLAVNTYVTLAEAEAYLDTRLHAESWRAATADDKTRALISAQRALSRIPYRWHKTTLAQVLDFPRISRETDDSFYYATDPTVVPRLVKDAQCEEALALLVNDVRALAQSQGVTSQSAGDASESYAPRSQAGLLSAEAHRMLAPWIESTLRIARPR